MALRWRHPSGELICAAKSRAHKGDTYIDDTLHYELSVIQKVLVPALDEGKTGRWFWLHGECITTTHPEDVPRGVYVRAEQGTR